MKLAAIHHVAIIVSDYEKSKDFYVNKLGFAVVRENFRKERNDWKLDLRVGDGAAVQVDHLVLVDRSVSGGQFDLIVHHNKESSLSKF